MNDGPIRRDAAGSTGSDEPGIREVVTGWGRNPSSVSQVTRPANPDELAMAVKTAGPRGAIARGLGRSYGDQAMNAGGLVVDATRVSGLLELDQRAGTARVLAGTSLSALLREIVPQGWFV
ncbi:MAG TPA: FAD-binding protein, partial [Acidimicrobiales bacterium]